MSNWDERPEAVVEELVDNGMLNEEMATEILDKVAKGIVFSFALHLGFERASAIIMVGRVLFGLWGRRRHRFLNGNGDTDCTCVICRR